MQMTYPLQFRQKVFSTKEKFHLTFEQTSQRFDVPIRTLFRWQRTIGYGLQRLGISYKKTLQHPKANEQARSDFQNKIDAYKSEGRTIVYLDESGFARDGPRTHGYAYRGKRCYGVHDWHAKGRINVIGAMVGFGLVSVGLFEGSINSDVFYAWLTQALVPV